MNKRTKLQGFLLFWGLVLVLAVAAGIGIGCSQGTACQTEWLGDGLCDNACNDAAHNYDDGDCVVKDDSYLSFTNGGLTISATTTEDSGKKTTTMTDSSGNVLLTSELTINGVKLTFPGVSDPTIITFPEPLDELPTNYAASLLATFIAGQLKYYESGVMPDSPGCDWFHDQPCTLSCCAHHDKCFYDYDCSALSWVAFVGSDECKACNYVASHCIVSSCAGVNSPTYIGPAAGTCYDRECDRFYSCPTLVGGKAGIMNCDCPSPCDTGVFCSESCLWSDVGDGNCDPACNNEACRYDYGECSATPTPSGYCAPGCPNSLLGDKTCNSACNNYACYYDGGDCYQCEMGCYASLIGDTNCDHHCYTAACNWDGGDCATLYSECALGCPASWKKDGECDSTCNNAACDWDGGDCAATPTPAHTTTPTATQGGYCAPDCPSYYIGDGRCDLDCYNAACDWDGGYDTGDCASFTRCAYGCLVVAVGDGWCDSACNVAACNYDGGDCSGEPTPTQGSGGSATPYPTQSGCYCEIGDTECFNAPCR